RLSSSLRPRSPATPARQPVGHQQLLSTLDAFRLRRELKTRRPPSGDQTAACSSVASNVKRVRSPLNAPATPRTLPRMATSSMTLMDFNGRWTTSTQGGAAEETTIRRGAPQAPAVLDGY